MLILAVDTALDACSAAVLADDRVVALRSEFMTRGHQERLAPLVAETMDAAGATFTALDRLAVTVGPGSFTGLRVGLAFTKGLALALAKPLVGIGVLEALLAELDAAPLAPATLRIAAVDARHGQVHLQIEDEAPCCRALDVAAGFVRAIAGARPTVVTGPAAAALAERLPGAQVIERATPDPAVVARMAASRLAPVTTPSLLYLRAPDARTLAERARVATGA